MGQKRLLTKKEKQRQSHDCGDVNIIKESCAVSKNETLLQVGSIAQGQLRILRVCVCDVYVRS